MNAKDVRTLQTSERLLIDKIPPSFQLKKVVGIQSTALKGSLFKEQLVLEGKAGETVAIEGDGEILVFLRYILKSMRGASWNEIQQIHLPTSADILRQRCEQIETEVEKAWEQTKEFLLKIDQQVCRLYGLKKREIDESISKFR